MACKALAPNPTAQLPRRPHPPAPFHYSRWQERSPHPQPGLNKRPSDITSCRLQNSPGLPTSDHQVPGHAGPSRQGHPAHDTLRTLKQLKQKPQGRKATHSQLHPRAAPPGPRGWEAHSVRPACQPSPSANPREPQPRPACRQTPPDPDTPPLTLLQELQTQSHEGRMGARGPETGRDRKGERGDREETGGWAERRGGQELWAKEQVPKGAFSTGDTEW